MYFLRVKAHLWLKIRLSRPEDKKMHLSLSKGPNPGCTMYRTVNCVSNKTLQYSQT